MMAWKVVVRSITLIAAVCCLGAVAIAQNVTVSPSHLSFAVPTGGTSPTAAQTATFSVTGEGSVTVASVGIGGAQAGDFSKVQDTCTGVTLNAPAACSVTVAFSSASAPGVLEHASLTFFYGLESSKSVDLTGAAGAIKLFDPTIVAPSNGNATLSNPFTYGSTTLSLSCPATDRTGTVSSTPDGSGFVLEDNYVTLAINGTPANTDHHPDGNVCRGGPADNNNGTLLNDCFTTNYQVPAGGNQLNGRNPDDFANAGNSVLVQQSPNADNAGGVTPIDISGFLPSGPSTVTFTLLDGGGFVAGASLFLKTNCTVAGVQTGGTLVGAPIDPDSPASLTPIFNFNSTGGQHIQFGANYINSNANLGDTPTPTVADTAVPPGSFAALVHGTSAGPAVCMRFSGELDGAGNPQCKAFTITCTIGGTGEASGTNCPQSPARDVLFKATFDSIDTPTSQNQIAPDTGAGFLMGTDNWVSTASNCTFENPGVLATQLCPQNTLTQFVGGDPIAGGTTRTTNSTFIPVLNMPLPITLPVVTSANLLGCLAPTVLPCWQKATTVSVKFFASPAIYPFFNPLPANGFLPAPIQSVTFGTNKATVTPPVPDTTYPIATDIALNNSGACPLVPGGIFTANKTITQDTASGQTFGEGRYILHYFATDCASTEELKFRVKNDQTSNWASFKTVQINIDTTRPTITFLSKTVNTNSRGGTVKITFKCDDPPLADSSLGSGVVTCGPFLFLAPAHTGSVTSTFSVKTQHGTINLNGTDLAGNSAVPVSVPF